ncbi:SHOCT domain-containing protein [Halohasta salina]|uniref:SHOCT domain-containing protein n=1 Tax=Halohasta salina TaxID=2961621 RepID=UPI0020A330D3|nr:SHOCT domain-containing protein [Halohasta salina]
MSIESRVEAGGRWVLQSPLWTGVAVTLFFVLPTLVIPGVPLWVSAALAVTLGPPIIVGLYVIYGTYRWLVDAPDADTESVDEPTDPVDRLKHRYARGEIDESTFERRLETLLETDELTRELDRRDRIEVDFERRQ